MSNNDCGICSKVWYTLLAIVGIELQGENKLFFWKYNKVDCTIECICLEGVQVKAHRELCT